MGDDTFLVRWLDEQLSAIRAELLDIRMSITTVQAQNGDSCEYLHARLSAIEEAQSQVIAEVAEIVEEVSDTVADLAEEEAAETGTDEAEATAEEAEETASDAEQIEEEASDLEQATETVVDSVEQASESIEAIEDAIEAASRDTVPVHQPALARPINWRGR